MPIQRSQFSAFGSISDFENAQRMAKALCSSSIVPANYQGDSNLGSCVIALEISNRIGASVLAVMQNLYVVHGKPGWSSQFLISCVNASRKFTPLRYRMTGEKGKDSWGCIAWATDKTGEVLESPEVTIEMAKAEGWYGKNGSKWKTMPELMLRYRTATLFARLADSVSVSAVLRAIEQPTLTHDVAATPPDCNSHSEHRDGEDVERVLLGVPEQADPEVIPCKYQFYFHSIHLTRQCSEGRDCAAVSIRESQVPPSLTSALALSASMTFATSLLSRLMDVHWLPLLVMLRHICPSSRACLSGVTSTAKCSLRYCSIFALS